MTEKLKIIFVSHTYMGGTYVVGSHHLSAQLKEMGHDVLHISTPVSIFHWFNKNLRRTNRSRFTLWKRWKEFEDDEVKNIVPFTIIPWKLTNKVFRKFGINLMTNTICFPRIKTVTNFYGFENTDILLIDQPNFVGIENKINSKVKLYRATDLYSQMTEDEIIINAESKILSSMNGLIATSQPVLDHLSSLNAELPCLLLENGVELLHFDKSTVEPYDLKDIPHPRAIYIGAIDKRLDIASLLELANKEPQVNIIIIGIDNLNVSEQINKVNNIHYLGQKPYDIIPEYLNNCDIGLLPLSNHESNEGRSPMKLYEYAAAGLAVVSKKTYEIARRNEEFVFLYDKNDEISIKFQEAIDYRRQNNNRTKALAKKHSWENKSEELIRFVQELD